MRARGLRSACSRGARARRPTRAVPRMRLPPEAAAPRATRRRRRGRRPPPVRRRSCLRAARDASPRALPHDGRRDAAVDVDELRLSPGGRGRRHGDAARQLGDVRRRGRLRRAQERAQHGVAEHEIEQCVRRLAAWVGLVAQRVDPGPEQPREVVVGEAVRLGEPLLGDRQGAAVHVRAVQLDPVPEDRLQQTRRPVRFSDRGELRASLGLRNPHEDVPALSHRTRGTTRG